MSIIDPRSGAPLSRASSTTAQASTSSTIDSQMIVSINRQNFQSVMQASMQTPVLLLSFSHQHPACQQFLPIIEAAAKQYQGQFTLAELEIEAFPEAAAQLAIQALPDAKLISQGQLLDQFSGSLTAEQLDQWLAQYFSATPISQTSSLAETAAAALAAGNGQQAQQLYQQLIKDEPDQEKHQLGLVEALILQQDFTNASAQLNALSKASQESEQGKMLIKRLALINKAPRAADLEAFTDRNDSEALYAKALFAFKNNQLEQAMQLLLQIVHTDRQYQDSIAQQTLLQLFEILGKNSPLAADYRQRLFALLY